MKYFRAPIFLLLLLLACRQKRETLFESLPSSTTGITFANQLTETERDNILTYEYFYNGGGVATGDFNNDGLTDLFFTGNQVPNQLYLNRGGLRFDDASEKAGIGGRPGGWKTGVSLVDVNADGWLDVYVCYSGPNPPEARRNQLFVNTTPRTVGKGAAAVTFAESGEAYGLADPGYSTQAAFFDYDGDGDLDCFLMNHNLRGYQRQEAHVMRAARDPFAGDKLMRNDGGRFTDVTEKAGIKGNPLGFGLGLAAADLTGDGRPDLYVGNDYVEDDYLYVNRGDGTFGDALREKLDHTSRFTMGLEVADVNNDALPDLLTLDMLPEDNARQKLLSFPDNWNSYQATLHNGFWHQNMRNMLHLNNGDGTFSETGQLAGVHATDWSWAPLAADFDNDGWKDLFVTNGELRDLTNSDFIKYASDEEAKGATGGRAEAFLDQIKKMPSSQTRNYAFKNLDGVRFGNRQREWGFDESTVANGAACADLDNDGDLDLVTNTNNGPARLYRNHQVERAGRGATPDRASGSHFLSVKLAGPAANPFGVGARVWLYPADGGVQYQEFAPVRGFQSCLYAPLHFGLGAGGQPVRLRVVWPDGRQQTLRGVTPGRAITLRHGEATERYVPETPAAPLYRPADTLPGYRHRENYANDFTRQLLLPYAYSYTGARLAVGDVNGDGTEEVYAGGARNQAGRLYTQRPDGTFAPFAVRGNGGGGALAADSAHEDKDAVFFDADGDGDLDLYVVSGDYGLAKNHPQQQDRLYRNDGRGGFARDTAALPRETANGSCVKVLDYDRDGDADLFVGGTVVPGLYPVPEPSFLLRNDGGTFRRAADFMPGLVTDAAVTDLNGDGYADVLAVGEWMPPTVFYNDKGTLRPGASLPLATSLHGWWNRVAADDLDWDGDADLVLGNLGRNAPMKASPEEPVTLDFGDFDGNGTVDPILSYYVGGASYPAVGRDEALEQLAGLRKKFTSYESFSKATINDFFTPEQRKAGGHLRMDFAETAVLENTGQSFALHRLPVQAQYAPVHAIAVGDFDGDGHKDLLLAGNQSMFRLRIGKMDANHGVLLAGEGKFAFRYVPQAQSGFRLRGDVKDVRVLPGNTLLFSLNDGPVRVYRRAKGQNLAAAREE